MVDNRTSITDIDINSVLLFNIDSLAFENSAIHFLRNTHTLPKFNRFFFIDSGNMIVRGNHAHKLATQAFIVVKGEVVIVVHDGVRENRYQLSVGNECVVIPPGIWSRQIFSPDSVLFVLTDVDYSEQEYIREWEEYLQFKGLK
ncbi:WxcM-like, C-terminal [actinobacterium SCGC AAA044-D11]